MTESKTSEPKVIKTSMMLSHRLEGNDFVIRVHNVWSKDMQMPDQVRNHALSLILTHDFIQDHVNKMLNLKHELTLSDGLPRLKQMIGLSHHEEVSKKEAEEHIGKAMLDDAVTKVSEHTDCPGCERCRICDCTCN